MASDRSEPGIADHIAPSAAAGTEVHANAVDRGRPGDHPSGVRVTRKTVVRAKSTHRSLEHALVLLVLIAGLPAGLALLYLTWGQDYTFEVRWTITAVVLAVWLGAAVAAYQMVTRALYLQANLLGALREGDYSIRGVGAHPGSAVDLVLQEINELGDTL